MNDPIRTRLSLGAMLAAAAVLAACATPTTVPAELVSARDTVHAAAADPNVLNYAPLELKKASDALARADALNAKGSSLADIATAAYVAQREAQAAVALGRSKADADAAKNAEIEREHMRAEAGQAAARVAQAEASSARAEAMEAQNQAARAQEQSEVLQQQLDDLQARETDRGTLVTLGDVLFEFGRAQIKATARDDLQRLADFLLEHPERHVLVEGYTDSVGSDYGNLILSQRRANAVASALEELGVTPDRIATKGYGKDYPVADNSTDTNRAMNRRVEVYISDDNQPVRARG